MITKTHFRNIITLFGLTVALTIFITRPGFSQDTTKSTGKNKVRIEARIVTDKDGKMHEFDTTINLDRKMKPGEEQEMMKEFESRFKDLGEQMKDLEVEMNELRIPDSGMMDSVQQLTEKALKLSRGHGNFHSRHNFSPRAFNYEYNFEMPEIPDMPQPQIEEFNDENAPGEWKEESHRIMRGRSESLNDLLGDIPMERVKSYSIKDTKNGKRITIELNNEPLIEHHRDVIILRAPRPDGRHRQGPEHRQMQKRIIIREGDQEKQEQPDKL
jgi:hypothetical protein